MRPRSSLRPENASARPKRLLRQCPLRTRAAPWQTPRSECHSWLRASLLGNGTTTEMDCQPIQNLVYLTGMKPVEFRGSALEDLRAFPEAARREAGYQLDRVQHGREPDDWKPMNTVGRGVREIRIRDAAGAFRVLYVAKFDDAVYVLHCFQKKTQKTSRTDLNLATQRYRDLLKELGQ